ncbi:MAG: enoyl-CoA hydratase/isomerase family protein [Gemmatimonadaceae bacterium]|nr:enoyl-CoA hydratase/isomerase family protein [Gemmatimonadaceae bacterium]
MTSGDLAAHQPVRLVVDGDILVATIDNPPVNALGQQVRAGLLDALQQFEDSPQLRVMVLRAEGALFIGGADIREFAGPRLEPLLATVCDRYEACTKPIVAVIQGAALGGGFEIALAAHYRVASSGAEFAFPEITLGLLPGAGGTQRTPRLAGVECALELMLRASRMSAERACAVGLVDRVAYDALDEGMHWARELAETGGPVKRALEGRAIVHRTAALEVVGHCRRDIMERTPQQFAALQIVECVEAAIVCSGEEGLIRERVAFARCLGSPERAALVHVFFAERAARKREVDLESLGRMISAARDDALHDTNETNESREEILARALFVMRETARRLRQMGLAGEDGDCDVASIQFAGFPRESGGILWHAQHDGSPASLGTALIPPGR